jgi:hypothetical protein
MSHDSRVSDSPYSTVAAWLGTTIASRAARTPISRITENSSGGMLVEMVRSQLIGPGGSCVFPTGVDDNYCLLPSVDRILGSTVKGHLSSPLVNTSMREAILCNAHILLA